MQAAEPKIHLITLSEHGNELEGFSNADVAKFTVMFLQNVPNRQLKIAHLVVGRENIVVGTKQVTKNVKPRFLKSETLKIACSEGCQFRTIYGGDAVPYDEKNGSKMLLDFYHTIERPSVVSISGEKGLTNFISGLNLKNDIVVFYYTGHGEYNIDREENELWFSSGNKCSVKTIKNVLRDKDPQLIVMLIDACSSEAIPLSPSEEISEKCEEQAAEGCLNKVQQVSILFKTLFLQYTGIVEFYASEIGKPALTYGGFNDVNRGGIFTEAICRSVLNKEDERKDINWDDFMEELKNQSQDVFSEYHGSGGEYFPGCITLEDREKQIDKGIKGIILKSHFPRMEGKPQKLR
ncbi:hypothetical protein FACS1894214_4990 [Planctomycetales bacterium]|nr:hypothetical protein FACS1894214_4990 [Planctomycetales bacterium]